MLTLSIKYIASAACDVHQGVKADLSEKTSLFVYDKHLILVAFPV